MAPALPAAGRSGAAHAPARGGAPRVRRTSSLGLMTADDGSLVVSLSSVNDSPRKKAAAERLQGQGGRTGSSRSPSTAARGKAGEPRSPPLGLADHAHDSYVVYVYVFDPCAAQASGLRNPRKARRRWLCAP